MTFRVWTWSWWLPVAFALAFAERFGAVEDAIRHHGAPVYVRRAIVHNLEVVRSLEAQGAIFVEVLSEVPEGAVVIFSAHGVAPAISNEAATRGLKAFDAVCPLVAKVHREVDRHERNGRTIVLIGHKGHPEIEATLGRLEFAHLVESVGDVAALPIPADAPIAYAVQTTYSEAEAAEIIDALRRRYKNLAEPPTSDICYATTNRQRAINEIAESVDAVIVVGEHFSSNACRLAEVASIACSSVQLAAGPAELDWSKLPRDGSLAITAAASTPETSVQAVIDALRERFHLRVVEQAGEREPAWFKPLAVA